MKTPAILLGAVLVSSSLALSTQAQQPQIPTLQVCNATSIRGSGMVRIESRAQAGLNGTFSIKVELKCEPDGSGYPAGGLVVSSIKMSDSSTTSFEAISFEQVTTTGKHSPTAYLNGRCKAPEVRGCRFWMTIADNKRAGARGAQDIVGFLVLNGVGKRVAYGTGPLIEGDITVAPTSN